MDYCPHFPSKTKTPATKKVTNDPHTNTSLSFHRPSTRNAAVADFARTDRQTSSKIARASIVVTSAPNVAVTVPLRRNASTPPRSAAVTTPWPTARCLRRNAIILVRNSIGQLVVSRPPPTHPLTSPTTRVARCRLARNVHSTYTSARLSAHFAPVTAAPARHLRVHGVRRPSIAAKSSVAESTSLSEVSVVGVRRSRRGTSRVVSAQSFRVPDDAAIRATPFSRSTSIVSGGLAVKRVFLGGGRSVMERPILLF